MDAQLPFHERFAAWFADAVAHEPDVPDAMAVASVDERGAPHVRMVLLKDHGPEGFVFYTNLGSAKGRQILADGRVSAVLHWKSLERQVRIDGLAEQVDDATADAYFASRPRGSQVGAWASRQSEVLDARATLEARIRRFDERFEGDDVPRPPFWSGFLIRPHRVEFWQGHADRLHDRLVYTRSGADWTTLTLYP